MVTAIMIDRIDSFKLILVVTINLTSLNQSLDYLLNLRAPPTCTLTHYLQQHTHNSLIIDLLLEPYSSLRCHIRSDGQNIIYTR